MWAITRNRLFRGSLGFVAGLAMWLGLAVAYHSVVALGAEQLMNLFESPNVTRLVPKGKDVILVRTDFDPRSPHPQLPVGDLTFNVVLLSTLLAAAGPPFALGKGGRWIAAFAALYSVHVAALSTKVMALYVLRMGEWSRVHYGTFARDAWSGADHFYRFVGVYASVFIIWWLAREGEEVRLSSPRSRKRR